MHNSKRTFTISALVLMGALLGACETVPYPERVAAYETKVKAEFVGKSVDALLLAKGPPESSYTLTDGRDVIQYLKERSYTTGGGTYTDYHTEVIGYKTFTRDNGTTKQIPITRQVPYLRTDPLVTHHEKCAQRFVISKAKIVEDFKWEGNSCF